MELCDAQIIQCLIDVQRQPEAPGQAKTPKTRGRANIRRCTCGQCATCADNDRWERIFQQKFADPAYYAPRPVRHASSLEFVS